MPKVRTRPRRRLKSALEQGYTEYGVPFQDKFPTFTKLKTKISLIEEGGAVKLREILQKTKTPLHQIIKRIDKLLELYENQKDLTNEAYGMVNSTIKKSQIVGSLNKLIANVRADEVLLSGEVATPQSYEVPKHPWLEKPIEEFDFVQDGLITKQKFQEILHHFEISQESFDYEVPAEVGKEKIKTLADAITIFSNFNCIVSIKQNLLRIFKFVSLRHGRKNYHKVDWKWPEKYVQFVLPNVRSSTVNTFKEAMPWKIKFTWSHGETSAGFSHTFVQAEMVEPAILSRAFNGDISNFKFHKNEELAAGKYHGAMYKFCIRNVKNSAENIDKFMKNFKERGYINYFALKSEHQGDVHAMDFAKFLIQKQYKEAADLVLSPNFRARNFFMEPIKSFNFIFEDAKAVVDTQPPPSAWNSQLVYSFLQQISNESDGNENEYAFNMLSQGCHTNPKFFRERLEIFLNHVWNQTVNLLIERRGLKLAVGDLVFMDKEVEKNILYNNKVDGSVAGRTNLRDAGYKDSVMPLTQEDINSDRYTIFDLVVPVCGCNVKWPKNDIAKYVGIVLQKHGIPSKEFVECNKNIFHLVIQGVYRKVLAKSEKLTWRLHEGIANNKTLLMDDIPSGKSITIFSDGKETQYKYDTAQSVNDDEEDERAKWFNMSNDESKALVVEFFIPKTTHILVPLRELMKRTNLGFICAPIGQPFQVDSSVLESFIRTIKTFKQELEEEVKRTEFVRPQTAFLPSQADIIAEQAKRIELLEQEISMLREKDRLRTELELSTSKRFSAESHSRSSNEYRRHSPEYRREASREITPRRYDEARSYSPPSRQYDEPRSYSPRHSDEYKTYERHEYPRSRENNYKTYEQHEYPQRRQKHRSRSKERRNSPTRYDYERRTSPELETSRSYESSRSFETRPSNRSMHSPDRQKYPTTSLYNNLYDNTKQKSHHSDGYRAFHESQNSLREYQSPQKTYSDDHHKPSNYYDDGRNYQRQVRDRDDYEETRKQRFEITDSFSYKHDPGYAGEASAKRPKHDYNEPFGPSRECKIKQPTEIPKKKENNFVLDERTWWLETMKRLNATKDK